MKKVILMLTVIFVGGTVFAQKVSESDVPAAVKTKFSSLYPNAKVEEWKKDNGNYKAEFDENKTETCVIINPKGDLVKTKTEIEATELPAAANEYLAKKYAGKKITECHKMTDANGIVTYKAEVGEMHVIFDSNGAFVKEGTEKDMKNKK